MASRALPEACVAAEHLRLRRDDLLSLESAEQLFWSGGKIGALDELERAPPGPSPEPEPLGPTRLWRCPNCWAYGVFLQTKHGRECENCCWSEQLAPQSPSPPPPPSSTVLPALLSPRDVEQQRRVEQRRLVGEVRALHRRAYTKAAPAERPLGAVWSAREGLCPSASRFAVSLASGYATPRRERVLRGGAGGLSMSPRQPAAAAAAAAATSKP